MLKGACRVKLVKTVGWVSWGTEAATGHSLSSGGMNPGERVLADHREPHSALLGLLLPMTAILIQWFLLRNILVLQPPTGLLKGTEWLSKSAYCSLSFCLKLP